MADVELGGIKEGVWDFVEGVGVEGEEMLAKDSFVGKTSWMVTSVMLGAMIEGTVQPV